MDAAFIGRSGRMLKVYWIGFSIGAAMQDAR
jgi:hypothetical protein